MLTDWYFSAKDDGHSETDSSSVSWHEWMESCTSVARPSILYIESKRLGNLLSINRMLPRMFEGQAYFNH